MATKEKYKEEVKLTFYNKTYVKIGTIYLTGWQTVDKLLEKFYSELDYYGEVVTQEGHTLYEHNITYIEIEDGH